MKTRCLIESCLMSMVALWVSSACALFGFGLTTFQEAYSKGAKARIEFRVVDDTGCPIKGATVNVFFDMPDRSKGRRVIEQTDTNGVCIAEEKTKGVLEIQVSREGYYRSNDLISFIDMGHEHEV
ncbi:MAG: carboxypeptidase regulatory-like domain-containing protein, partial [Kiritimatiellae bacterium]|nr:carboxypeptidase regulatory-like domain-containing protein [Kiritimatiellia bacterium]